MLELDSKVLNKKCLSVYYGKMDDQSDRGDIDDAGDISYGQLQMNERIVEQAAAKK